MVKSRAPVRRRKRKVVGAAPGVAGAASFPVVGIGASAGGLEAISAFLKALPARSGMAFVVIQHLAPEHESALAQLLSRQTGMPVREASDGLALQRNHVYVIPPNKSMTVSGAALHLAPREGSAAPHHPIDEFFTALSREQKAAAIGILLSGSGSDGALGMKAIKAEGGVTFAQDPRTAAWPAMPSSAISAGAADFVLPPAEIAAELARVSRHPYVVKNGAPDHADSSHADALENVHALLRSATGVDFRLYKQPTVSRRVARRMALKKTGSLGEYIGVLHQHPEEVKALADDIFIHVTGFFRDPECFQALRKRVFPKLHLARRTTPVRVWVPGCSTGEEVYSLAVLLLEALGPNARQVRIQMFGTDISESAVDRARAGIYPEAALHGVSAARLRRFFTKVEHGYQINKEVRSLCVFAKHDLAKDPPFSRLDLVSCRNVLIYAGPLLQSRMLSAFQYGLNPGGFLFLGKSESISGYAGMFAAEDRNHKIFSRKPALKTARPFDWHNAGRGEDALPPKIALPPLETDFQKQAEQILLQRYTPPAVVIDSDLRILHFQGDIGAYLALVTGPPTVHLLKMLRPEFVVGLRGAVSKAAKTAATSLMEPVRIDRNGQASFVHLEVTPLKSPEPSSGAKPDFLLVFKEVPVPAQRGKLSSSRSSQSSSQLERELAAARAYLSTLIAEHESAQEEMKAAHEEILSSSEELQSTNEELETAKEELQSSNEELLTLNEELLHRNLDLGVLTSDLNNLLVGVEIPVVVLDGSHHIRRFTPTAGKLLKLIESDVGRPFRDIASAFDVPDWDHLLAEVAAQGRPIQREVKDKHGRWHSLRIRPYRTADGKVDGVIVILLDTHVLQLELEESRDYAQMLLESAEQAIVAESAESRILLTNGATERMFGYRRAELVGRSLKLLLPTGIPAVGAGKGSRHQIEGRHKDGSSFPLEVHLSHIDQAGIALTVAFMSDITEQQRLERLSEAYRAEIRALAAQLITAQEEERRRVSRELHDGLCQRLASLAFDLDHLALALPPPAETRTRLRKLRERAVQVSEEARNLAYELHPSVLDDLGLVVSLKALCEEFAKAEKIRVKFTAGKLSDSIPQKVASGLYRIAQESMQNVAKHAKAKRLNVSLDVRDHSIVLSLEDDGVGFSPQSVKGKGGLGLVSIRERARILGGDLSIESKPRHGARIAVRVPLL